MNPCESHGKVQRNQQIPLLLEKVKGKQERNRVILLQRSQKKETYLQQANNPQIRKEEAQKKQQQSHLQQEHKGTFVPQEATHLQENSVKAHSHWKKKGTNLQRELKEAHLQQKGKKGTHLEEKPEAADLQQKQKKKAYWQQEQKEKEKNKRKQKQNFMWVKGRHSICLPKPSAICSSVRPRISSPPIVQGQIAAAREENDFKIWLRGRGEDEACCALMMGNSTHGRGLFASRPILAGDCILRISKHLVITPDKLREEVKHLLHENISSCARLALLILAEQNAGQESEWAPYMNCLPQLGALHNTVLWSNDELDLLRQSSSAYRQSIQFRATILEEFAAVQHVL